MFTGSAPKVGPYFADWRLKRNSYKVGQGIVTRLSGNKNEEFFSVAGQSYTHYLDRRIFPYDINYTLTTGNRVFAGGQYIAVDTPVHLIVRDILERLQNVDAYCLDYSLSIAAIDFHLLHWSIPLGDTESILSKIKALSELGYAMGGFDFQITKDKEFRLWYPEKGDPTQPVLYLSDLTDETAVPITDLGFSNDGPGATHVLGTASGGLLPVNRDFPGSSEKFRRLDKGSDYGDSVKSFEALDSMTSGDLAKSANPMREITPITVNANEIPDFWSTVDTGLYAYIVEDLVWHRIDSAHKIIKMDCEITNEGDENVTLGLDHWYDWSEFSGYDSP